MFFGSVLLRGRLRLRLPVLLAALAPLGSPVFGLPKESLACFVFFAFFIGWRVGVILGLGPGVGIASILSSCFVAPAYYQSYYVHDQFYKHHALRYFAVRQRTTQRRLSRAYS